MRKWLLTPFVLAALSLTVAVTPAMATALYPDLKTLSPRDLRFETTDVDPGGGGVIHNVLRFSNTVWNAGHGPVELRGQINPTTKSGAAIQRVYDDSGGFIDFSASNNFYWHAAHKHYHYDNWGTYELWTKADYDAWIASGRTQGSPVVGSKTTSCVEDEEFIRTLPNQPYPPVYSATGCFPNAQGLMLQGLSPGWGDTYDYYRPDQWIDLGPNGHLADGQYVLRSVVDPLNKIYESAGKSDPSTESAVDNEAITLFSVQGGKLVDGNPPSGSIRINDIDAATASPSVTVKVLGRDDISGPTQVKLSNDGNTWSAAQAYTGSGSTAQAIAWNLTNSTYGGNDEDGTKTVYAEIKDATGKWSEPTTDTIVLDRKGGSSTYSNTVLSDYPSGYWRLGEAGGTTAIDSSGGDNGTYTNGPTLNRPGLLSGDTNTAVSFDGSNDYLRVPSTGSLSPSLLISLEAWIKPTSLPSSGSFASILTKAESYSLQFNGPRLEFTIIQSGVRKRLQAASGAVVAGQTYHVVGTFDGTTQRLYLNGAQVASVPLTGAVDTNGNPVTIGSWGAGGEFFKGTIDEPAVYGSILSAARVLAHYQVGMGGAPPDPTIKDPSELTASPSSESQINLSWKDNSSNETEFLIQRDTSSSFSNPVVKTAWADSTILTDTGLAPNTTYYYRVRAKNATDSSGYSNVASATTLATTPPPTGYEAAVSADSPVSYWRLGEASGTTAADTRGLNPGAYANSPTLGAASLLANDAANKAVGFDGVNDQVKVANSASLALGSPLTLEAWIKPTSLPSSGGFASILAKSGSYALQFNGPKLEFTIIQSGTRKRLQAASGAVVAGQTYHVVGTFDGTTQRLYLNGVQVASTPLTGVASSTVNPLYVGTWDGGGEFFKGTIDEPAVYGSILSAARVLAHYQAGTGGAPPDPTVKDPSDLAASPSSESQINLSWKDNSSNETEFVVQRDTSPSFANPVGKTALADSTKLTDTGLAPNTTYYYRVKAINLTDSSGYSNVASATTLATTPPPTGYEAAVSVDSPVSYWRLAETSGTAAADARGLNPGAYANSPTLGAASLLANDAANKAVGFDGVNDQVKVANSASLTLGSPLTLEAWIKPTSLPSSGGFASILAKSGSYALQFNGPKLEFTIIQSGTRKRLQAASGAVVAGQTYHVVGTFDGTTQRLYLNGVQVASAPLSGVASSTVNPLYVGTWDGGGEFFKGTIDEPAVYGSILSAARVLAHYQAGTSTEQPVSLAVPAGSGGEVSTISSSSSGSYSIAAPATFVDYCHLPTPTPRS